VFTAGKYWKKFFDFEGDLLHIRYGVVEEEWRRSGGGVVVEE
jgi:hypothetical protein